MIKHIGLVGLGKMGYNLALNMKDHGFSVIATDVSVLQRDEARKAGIQVVDHYEALIEALPAPRVVWLMVPAGKIVESVIHEFSTLLSPEDIIIDGGNSMYLDTVRRNQELSLKGLHFVDCGTSGGTHGARHGACLMVGGKKEVVKSITHVFESVALPNGYAHVGDTGSGHYVKMVHNGIEYGMMQAIGEGFDLMHSSRFDIDYKQVAQVWANGSIIEGLLMRSVVSAVSKDPQLSNIIGRVDDSGEGQWMVEEALRTKVSLPVITASLFARYKSKDDTKFSEKVVAAMRNEFGGHAVYKK